MQPELKQMRKEMAGKAATESDAVPDITEEENPGITGDDVLTTMLNTPPSKH